MLVGSPVTSGILVTPQTALNFTAVYSAVNCIATDIACLPFGTQRREGQNAHLPAPEIAANGLMSARAERRMQ